MAAILSTGAVAQTVVGPSPPNITATVNVSADTTTIVGNTIISTSLTTAATNVTGGALVVDSVAGSNPGPVSITTANGNALQASATGQVSVPNGNITISTTNGHGALANGTGTSIVIADGATISNGSASASLAAIGGTIDATGVTMSSSASTRGHGAVAESGGTIWLRSGNSINRNGTNSIGFGASGANSTVTATSLVPVTTTGTGDMAVYMHDGGLVSLVSGSTFTLSGTASTGIVADNTLVPLGTIGSGLTINLSGLQSVGVAAHNDGVISLESVTVQGSGVAAGAWARTGGTVNLTGGSVINVNSSSNPSTRVLSAFSSTLITASGSVGGAFDSVAASPVAGLLAMGGTINSTGTTITVTAANAVGADAGLNVATPGIITLIDNTITTTGTNSSGIRVDNQGQIFGTGTSITTSGGDAALRINSAVGLIDLTDSTVSALGADTAGLVALNFAASGTNTVNLTNVNLGSEQDAAVIAVGPLDLTVDGGSVLTGGNGFLLQAFNGSSQPTLVTFNASEGSTLVGDGYAASLSTANLSLNTETTWTGASLGLTNVSLDASSLWNLTDDSIVRDTVANAGLIDFVSEGDTFKTLTTTNYLGSGGTVALNTFLGDDTSPSDLLTITGGTATGTGLLEIKNTTGEGALTVGNGILVVNAVDGGTTQPGLFELADPVLAGPYEYSLYRSSLDADGSENWYLRSTLLTSPEPPHYREEVSLIAAIPPMAALFGREMIDTFHERQGERIPLSGEVEEGENEIGWGRVIGLAGHHGGDPLGIYDDSGATFDFQLGGLQFGADLWRDEDVEEQTNDTGGLYLALGRMRGEVEHALPLADAPSIFAAGETNVTGLSLGGYWTHYGDIGQYLDVVVQATFYSIDTNSFRIPQAQTTGVGIAASLEGGYPFSLAEGWVLEPQAQAIFQAIDIRGFNDGFADISFDDTNSLVGRLGVRLAKSFDGGTPDDPDDDFVGWGRLNLWHEFLGSPTVAFSSEDGPVSFGADLRDTWLQVAVGGDFDIDATTSLWGQASYDFTLDGNSRALELKIGIKGQW